MTDRREMKKLKIFLIIRVILKSRKVLKCIVYLQSRDF